MPSRNVKKRNSSSGCHCWTSFLPACWQLICRVIEQQKPTRTCSQENSSNETWTVRQRRKYSHTRWDTRTGNAPQPVLQIEWRFTRRQTNGNAWLTSQLPNLFLPGRSRSASQQSSACQCTLSSELPSWSPALHRWVHTDVGARGQHEVILGLPEQLNHDGAWITYLQHLNVFRGDLEVLRRGKTSSTPGSVYWSDIAARTATKHGEKIGAHENGEMPSHKLDECSVRQDVNHMKTTKIPTWQRVERTPGDSFFDAFVLWKTSDPHEKAHFVTRDATSSAGNARDKTPRWKSKLTLTRVRSKVQ